MGRKPKAGGAKGKTTDPEQSERFMGAAREAGVDETGEAFEQAFDTIAAPGRHAPEAGRGSSKKQLRRSPK